jgi:hypothetical protein
MSELKLTSHVIERLAGSRPLMSELTLAKLAQVIAHKVDRFDPNKIHQVAVLVKRYDRKFQLGNSEGDCLIIAVDIRKKTIPTCFLRNHHQGKPRMAQVMIDIKGNVIG